MSKNGFVEYMITYPSRVYGNPNVFNVQMSVRVFVPWMPWMRKEIAFDKVNFQITKSLNGYMNVTQTNRTLKTKDNQAIVSTTNNTKFEVKLHDPHGKIYTNKPNIQCTIFLYLFY